MTVTIPESAQALVPRPEKTPAAIRAAIARIDPGELARFEKDWQGAIAKARDEYSILPIRHLVERWHMWVAVHRWPELAARLRECERIVAESEDRAARRAAGAEIGAILETAATAG
jgi:hypothetical protein